jgi:hypothetical protein
MAEKRTTYRNTRTDAVRQSSKALGYPYVVDKKSTAKGDEGDAKNGGDASSKGD